MNKPATVDLPKLVDSEDVAALFGIHPRTLYTWVADGRIPRPIRIGKRMKWRLSDIERLLEPSAT